MTLIVLLWPLLLYGAFRSEAWAVSKWFGTLCMILTVLFGLFYYMEPGAPRLVQFPFGLVKVLASGLVDGSLLKRAAEEIDLWAVSINC